jgi:SET domain-containing protein
MDSSKVIVKRTRRFGRGVFATAVIKKNEVIAAFDGPIYDAKFEGWTEDLLNHAIQFARNRWRDSAGIARLINHSCDPNCGIRSLFTIVAMRQIEKGEQITWDYEMTEKNDYGWRMKCKCGSPLCRKTIGDYRNMPRTIRKKYGRYISEWLRR